MRTCPECNAAMMDMKLEDYNRYSIVVRTENDKNVGNVACRVCPKCGYISLHLKDMAKLTKFLAGAKPITKT